MLHTRYLFIQATDRGGLYLVSAYHVPGTYLSTLREAVHLSLTTTQKHKCYQYPHSIDRETGLERLKGLELVRDRSGFESWVPAPSHCARLSPQRVCFLCQALFWELDLSDEQSTFTALVGFQSSVTTDANRHTWAHIRTWKS